MGRRLAGELSLARDVLLLVLDHLTVLDTARLMLTCRHLYAVAKDLLDAKARRRCDDEDADAFYIVYEELLKAVCGRTSHSASFYLWKLVPLDYPFAEQLVTETDLLAAIVRLFGSSRNLRKAHLLPEKGMSDACKAISLFMSLYLRRGIVLLFGDPVDLPTELRRRFVVGQHVEESIGALERNRLVDHRLHEIKDGMSTQLVISGVQRPFLNKELELSFRKFGFRCRKMWTDIGRILRSTSKQLKKCVLGQVCLWLTLSNVICKGIHAVLINHSSWMYRMRLFDRICMTL